MQCAMSPGQPVGWRKLRAASYTGSATEDKQSHAGPTALYRLPEQSPPGSDVGRRPQRKGRRGPRESLKPIVPHQERVDLHMARRQRFTRPSQEVALPRADAEPAHEGELFG